MRHGKKINHLSRTASHRKAMLSNMATSLIQNKRIVTTVAKAKALRKYVEPIINRSKTDTTHSRRMVFRYLQDKETVSILFNDISEKVADRPGGYTRILKTGNRLGDNASMCVIELVDYNEALLKESKPKKSRTRRSRRGKSAAVAATAATAAAAEEVQEAQEEAAVEEAEEEVVVEEQAAAKKEAAAEVADTAVTPEEQTEEVAEETAGEKTQEAAAEADLQASEQAKTSDEETTEEETAETTEEEE